MKILVTGKNGFIAKNGIEFFQKNNKILAISHTDSDEVLEEYCSICDFVFHLSAVQRSTKKSDFVDGNINYTKKLIYYLKKSNNNAPILFSTSTSVDKPSLFSITKLEAEKLLREYANENNVLFYAFKLNHIFGKYGKPNYNNVVSTFCYNIANDKPIYLSDPNNKITITYIDDLIEQFNEIVQIQPRLCNVKYIYCDKQVEISLGQLSNLIKKIKYNNCNKSNILEYNMMITYQYFKNHCEENIK